MDKFLKYYMPFRHAITFSGTTSGFFVFWLVVGTILALFPSAVTDAVVAGVHWFLAEVIMLGYGRDHPAMVNFLALFMPFILTMLLVLIENITGLWIPVYKKLGLPLE